MPACTCASLVSYEVPCTPYLGGIASVTIDEDGAVGTTPATIEVLPESSTFNSVMTFDKTKNVKYFTTDITLNIGAYTAEAKTFIDALPCKHGRTLVITLNSGHVITVTGAFVQTATFTPGTLKADGQSGTIVFQAISGTAPAVTNPAVVTI